MIVYVESNFVLEHALGQHDHESCEELLRMAEGGTIRLAIPAYSLMEPHETLTRRRIERGGLKRQLDKVLREIKQTASHSESREHLNKYSSLLLVKAVDNDYQNFSELKARLLGMATIIPLDKEVLEEAERIQEEHDLKAPDATVCASVLRHLDSNQGQKALFLNKNSKDFNQPPIIEKFNQKGCETKFSFSAGTAYLKSLLNIPSNSKTE